MSANDNFLKRLIRRFLPGEQPSNSTAESLKRLVGMIATTEDVELSCDEVLALLDVYAEMAIQGEDVAGAMPLVERHLGRCMDCSEEFEALMRILGSAPALGA